LAGAIGVRHRLLVRRRRTPTPDASHEDLRDVPEEGLYEVSAYLTIRRIEDVSAGSRR